jgi:hypothetical protein
MKCSVMYHTCSIIEVVPVPVPVVVLCSPKVVLRVHQIQSYSIKHRGKPADLGA